MRVISLTATILTIFAVLAVFAMSLSEQADAQFIPSESYFLTGNGFTITENELDGSTIGLTFSPEDTARTANMNIKDGFLIFQDREYDLANITGTLLRDGKFLRILGTAQDNQGNEISIRIFGRIVGMSADGFVYQLTGKIDQGNERFSFHFVTKSALSAQPLSEIINSKFLYVCPRIDSNLLQRNWSPLKTGRPMLILGKGLSFCLFNIAFPKLL